MVVILLKAHHKKRHSSLLEPTKKNSSIPHSCFSQKRCKLYLTFFACYLGPRFNFNVVRKTKLMNTNTPAEHGQSQSPPRVDNHQTMAINKLPYELWAEVFINVCRCPLDKLCNDNDTQANLTALSSVNKLFREVARTTPQLWSTWTNVYTKRQLEEYITRSSSSKLTIVASDLRANIPVEIFLQLVTPYAERWDHMFLKFVAASGAATIFPHYTKISAPHLKHLDIRISTFNIPGLSPQVPEFLLRFQIPTLVSLGGTMAYPPSCCCQLLQLDITFPQTITMPSLLAMLAQTTLLRKLRLSCQYPILMHDDLPCHPLHLSALQELSFKVFSNCSPWIGELFYYIQLPMLDVLDISVAFSKKVDTEPVHHRQLGSVSPKVLKIKTYRNCRWPAEDIIWGFMMMILPERLQELHLTSNNLMFDKPLRHVIPQTVRCVLFDGCRKLDFDGVTTFLCSSTARLGNGATPPMAIYKNCT